MIMISLFLPQRSLSPKPHPECRIYMENTAYIERTNNPGAIALLIRCSPHNPKDLSSVARAHMKLDGSSTHLLSHGKTESTRSLGLTDPSV